MRKVDPLPSEGGEASREGRPGGCTVKDDPKNPHPCVEVQYEQANADDGAASDCQLCHHPFERAFAFQVAEFAFDGDAVGFVFPPRFLFFRCQGPWPARGFAAEAYAPFPAPCPVEPGLMDFVGVDACGVGSGALAIAFSLGGEVDGFVVGVPRKSFQQNHAVDVTDGDFRSKFHAF